MVGREPKTAGTAAEEDDEDALSVRLTPCDFDLLDERGLAALARKCGGDRGLAAVGDGIPVAIRAAAGLLAGEPEESCTGWEDCGGGKGGAGSDAANPGCGSLPGVVVRGRA